jgi:hypothetical protein
MMVIDEIAILLLVAGMLPNSQGGCLGLENDR